MAARSRYTQALEVAQQISSTAPLVDNIATIPDDRVSRAVHIAGVTHRLRQILFSLDNLVMDCARAKGMYINNRKLRLTILEAGEQLAQRRDVLAQIISELDLAGQAENITPQPQLATALRNLGLSIAQVNFSPDSRSMPEPAHAYVPPLTPDLGEDGLG